MTAKPPYSYQDRLQDFLKHAKILNWQFAEFLNLNNINDIRDTFDILPANNVCGLPCFKLAVRYRGIALPDDIVNQANKIFDIYFGDYKNFWLINSGKYMWSLRWNRTLTYSGQTKGKTEQLFFDFSASPNVARKALYGCVAKNELPARESTVLKNCFKILVQK